MAIIKTARRTLIASGTVAAVVALGAFPVKLITVPEWRIQFTDLRGSALTGLEVEQNWQNYYWNGQIQIWVKQSIRYLPLILLFR